MLRGGTRSLLGFGGDAEQAHSLLETQCRILSGDVWACQGWRPAFVQSSGGEATRSASSGVDGKPLPQWRVDDRRSAGRNALLRASRLSRPCKRVARVMRSRSAAEFLRMDFRRIFRSRVSSAADSRYRE